LAGGNPKATQAAPQWRPLVPAMAAILSESERAPLL